MAETKVIDVSTLGVRTVVRGEMGVVPGPRGTDVLGMVHNEYEEQQPILGEKEVKQLKGVSFTLAPKGMGANFQTIAAGRRFLSDTDPNAIVMSEKRASALKGAQWKEVEGFPQGRFMCEFEGDRCFTNADVKDAIKLEATLAAEEKRQQHIAEAAVAKAELKSAQAQLKETNKELAEAKAAAAKVRKSG